MFLSTFQETLSDPKEACMKKNLVRAAFSMYMLTVFATSAYSQWVQTNWPEGNRFFDLYASRDVVFARIWDSLNGGRVFLTTDNGTSWNQVSSADSDMDILSIVMWNDNVLAGTWDGLYRPILDGTDWYWYPATSTGIPTDTAVWSLTRIGDTLFAGAKGHVYESSVADANTWAEAGAGIPADARVTSFVANGNLVLAASDSDGVFIATSDGTSWAAMNSGLADTHISQLVTMRTRLFALTLKGVFVSEVNDTGQVSGHDGVIWVSDPNGTTWMSYTNSDNWITASRRPIWSANGFGLDNVNCLLAVNDLLFAGTDG